VGQKERKNLSIQNGRLAEYIGIPIQNLFPREWSGKRGSNPRPSAWKADALPTELLPHLYKNKIQPLNLFSAPYKLKLIRPSLSLVTPLPEAGG
jgi:hypothetical protein